MWPESPDTHTLCFWQDLVTTEELVSSEPRVENFYLGLQLLFSQAGGRNESPHPHPNPHTLQRDLVAGRG